MTNFPFQKMYMFIFCYCNSSKIVIVPNDIINMPANALALVMPHIDYCSPVWTNCNNTHLNSLQIYHNRLARILLSAGVRTRIDDVMNSLNWFKLNKRWEKHLLVMIFKCVTQSAATYCLLILLMSNLFIQDSRFNFIKTNLQQNS